MAGTVHLIIVASGFTPVHETFKRWLAQARFNYTDQRGEPRTTSALAREVKIYDILIPRGAVPSLLGQLHGQIACVARDAPQLFEVREMLYNFLNLEPLPPAKEEGQKCTVRRIAVLPVGIIHHEG